jgi:soluble lytic murein transglycosylase-like protein
MFDDLIATATAKYSIDPKLAHAVMMHESDGKVDALGDYDALAKIHRARGLYQMHLEAVLDCGGTRQDWLDLTTDAAKAIDFGCHYLSKMLVAFDGDVPWSLGAWNQGIGVIGRAHAYAAAVQKLMNTN